MADDTTSFFTFQRRVLGGLWAWGLASMAAGLPLLAMRNPVLRQLGAQAVVWGAIDALLAYAGRRGALASRRRGDADERCAARRFRTILLINAVLDVGYIAGGLALIRRARGRAAWAGMGVGVVPQGLFLLCYDLLVAGATARRQWIIAKCICVEPQRAQRAQRLSNPTL